MHEIRTSELSPNIPYLNEESVNSNSFAPANSIHPNYMHNEVPAISSFTADDIVDVVSGTYKGDKILAYGITHYKYSDCDSKDLVNVGGGIKIHTKCKDAFEKMRTAAAKDGVNLYIVSGFRSEKYQITVFKKKFSNKDFPSQDEFKSRLRFSAPSGFSEHHTGLAIDINSTSQNFAKTKEYQWLQSNAHKYGFEISFPENGKQGLGFEPWHWRYVGDEESKNVFKAAREDL